MNENASKETEKAGRLSIFLHVLVIVILLAFLVWFIATMIESKQRKEREAAIKSNTAFFHNFFDERTRTESGFLGREEQKLYYTCPLMTSVTLVPSRYIQEFHKFAPKIVRSEALVVVTVSPQTYDPENCKFEILPPFLSVQEFKFNSKHVDTRHIEGELRGIKPYLATEFQSFFAIPKFEGNYEIRLVVAISNGNAGSSGDERYYLPNGAQPKQISNSLTINNDRLISGAKLNEQTVEWKPDSDDIGKVTEFVMTAGEWVSPGWLGKSIRVLRPISRRSQSQQ